MLLQREIITGKQFLELSRCFYNVLCKMNDEFNVSNGTALRETATHFIIPYNKIYQMYNVLNILEARKYIKGFWFLAKSCEISFFQCIPVFLRLLPFIFMFNDDALYEIGVDAFKPRANIIIATFEEFGFRSSDEICVFRRSQTYDQVCEFLKESQTKDDNKENINEIVCLLDCPEAAMVYYTSVLTEYFKYFRREKKISSNPPDVLAEKANLFRRNWFFYTISGLLFDETITHKEALSDIVDFYNTL